MAQGARGAGEICGRRGRMCGSGMCVGGGGNVREGDSGRGGGNIKWDVIKKRNGSQAMGI